MKKDYSKLEIDAGLMRISILTPGGTHQLWKGAKKVEHVTRRRIQGAAVVQVYVGTKASYSSRNALLEVVYAKMGECSPIILDKKSKDKIINYVAKEFEKLKGAVNGEKLMKDLYYKNEFCVEGEKNEAENYTVFSEKQQ